MLLNDVIIDFNGIVRFFRGFEKKVLAFRSEHSDCSEYSESG